MYAPTPRTPINAQFYAPPGPPIPKTVPIQPGDFGVEEDDLDEINAVEEKLRAVDLNRDAGRNGRGYGYDYGYNYA